MPDGGSIGGAIGGVFGGPGGAAIGSSIGGLIGGSTSGSRSSGANSSATESLINAGRQGISRYEDALTTLDEAFLPYEAFGLKGLERASGMLDPSIYLNDPVVKAISDEAKRNIFSHQAVGGRLSTPETGTIFQDALLRLQPQMLSSAMEPAVFGGNFAVRRGAAEIETARGIADLLAQIGNATAAGTINAADIANERDANRAKSFGSLIGGIGELLDFDLPDSLGG